MRSITAGVLILFLGVRASAQSDGASPGTFSRRGLVFEAGLGPHFSTSQSISRAGHVVFMGAGYNIGPRFAFALRVYTGAQEVQQDVTRPVWGRFPLGGGGLEATFFFNDGETWRPYVAGGYELVTLLGDTGYNGGGLRIACGMQMGVSRFFALNAEVQYARWRFYNLVRVDDTAGTFVPFVDPGIGGHLSISFYPNILP